MIFKVIILLNLLLITLDTSNGGIIKNIWNAGKNVVAMKALKDTVVRNRGDVIKKAATTAKKAWKITNPEKVVYHPRHKKIYKDSNTRNWWSKDTAGHGGSKWKVFKETSKGLEWMTDADEYGNYMNNKHKSDIGKFIPWKDVSKVTK